MKKQTPKTEAEWAAKRCQLSCRIGIAAINHAAIAEDGYETRYAIYNLLCAVENLSQQIAHEAKAPKDTK